MTRYIWHEGQWWPAAPRAPQPRVHIISDHMQPLRHPATGAVIDSKSAFRAITRANGYMELGNDAPATTPSAATDPKDVRADVIEAMQMVEQGHQTEPLPGVAPGTRIYD